MKKIRVIVKDKTILELQEDASKGDLIDLKEVVQVDTSYLDSIIEEGKDRVYATKLEEAKKLINAENALKVNKLQSEIDSLKEQNVLALQNKEQEIKNNYQEQIAKLNEKINLFEANKKHELDNLSNIKQSEISDLKNQIEMLKKDKESAIALKEQEVINNYNAKIISLNNEIASMRKVNQKDLENNKLKLEKEFSEKINKLQKEREVLEANQKTEIEKIKSSMENDKAKILSEQKEKYENELKAKDDLINNLQRAKASLNVKQTGEDLEAWCDNEVVSYMQNGLYNCTWTKDNKVVKDEDETKGSKADYIFRIYADKQHNDVQLLTSVCLDMKDENPDSTNKKANADYYKQLDKNREKKNCKYAVLVSNLEMDKPNVLPIFKVREYEDMYVVRPAYLMTFLNMISSLTTRFANIVLSKQYEELKLKSKNELLEIFADIKNTYLDKPLISLEKSVEDIIKNSSDIKNACRKIDDQCEKIQKNYISQITEKINKYELKLNKDVVKKLM